LINFPVEIEKSVLLFGEKNYNKQHFHMVYGVDDNYVKAAGISIISILVNNPTIDFIFHIFIESISDDNLKRLRKVAEEHTNAIIKIHYIDASIFNNLPTTEQFTKATYNRFLVSKVIKNETDRAVYVDADIICISSLEELLEMPLPKIAYVVPDLEEFAILQQNRLRMKEDYWNAGVMYINIKAWEENKISEQALQYSIDNIGKLDFLDQDALNKVLEGKVTFLARKYDYIFDIKRTQFRDALGVPSDTVFIHYTGYKPWQAWYCHDVQEYFLSYYKLSPWKDISLQQPCTYREMKEMAKGLRRVGQPLSSVYWYIKYICKKITTKYLAIENR